MKRAVFLSDSFSSCSSEDELSSNSDIDDLADRNSNSVLSNSTIKDHEFEQPSKRQNIIYKLINRERTGYFAEKSSHKIKKNAFNTVPNRLSFCLKDIVPYCYLTGHVFMGLTACGQFLLSYRARCDDDLAEHSYVFTAKYKYELYFWIYRPHNLLSKYYKVCLFDDHGVDNLIVVSITQWITNPRTIIVHGSSEFETEDSYLTIVSVPKLGCLDCKKLRDEFYSYNSDAIRSSGLCIRCNLTIHTKYSRSESDPKFCPNINLNSPERIIIFSDGLIHMLNVGLELNKQPKVCSNSIDSSYINKRDRNIAVLDNASDDRNTITSKHFIEDSISNSNVNNLGTADENIVARIIADFAECETDSPSQEKYPRIDKAEHNSNKHFEELVITCSGTSSTSEKSSNRVRLISHRSHRIMTKNINSTKSGITTVDLHSSSSTSGNQNLDKAAKAYEFSEDNEKCEKISTFRKRRLADKKYEFSEDNSENIIPFTKLRSTAVKNFALRTKNNKASSLSPSHHSNTIFNTSSTSFEMTTHTHRASPSHGFRSPCGSPVGNRYIMSPPGRTSNLYAKSPTYTKPFSSPRHINKRSHFDILDSVSNPILSPRNEDLDGHKTLPIQPLSEVKPSNIDVLLMTNTTPTEKNEKDKPICSKILVRRYVEEDDATSVITSEEDDCISPGYHTSLPVEVHGACYSGLQMVSQTSHQKLKCASVIITQHTFDLETLTYHIANYLCALNNKKYGFFYDWAYQPVNVCPISCNLTCILIVNFIARELHPPSTKQCVNCSSSQNLDCVFHRKHYECCSLFTWDIDTGDWQVLDYGDLVEVSPILAYKHSGELNNVVKKIASEFSVGVKNHDIFNNIRVLDSSIDKSKEILTDIRNSIEFHRNEKSPIKLFTDRLPYYYDFE